MENLIFYLIYNVIIKMEETTKETKSSNTEVMKEKAKEERKKLTSTFDRLDQILDRRVKMAPK